jgi:hypothetical protein
MLTWTKSEITLNETVAKPTLDHYQIIRRNGAVVPFEPSKIAIAVMKAFLAIYKTTQNSLQKSIFAVLREYGSWVVSHLSLHKHTVGVGFISKIKVVPLVLNKSNGFFSAGKTNLRNAP